MARYKSTSNGVFLYLAKRFVMNKQQKKLARKASTIALEARFPKGAGKGDPLSRNINLGDSFRSIGRMDFRTERNKK